MTKEQQLQIKQLDAILSMEQDEMATLSNASAVLNSYLDQVNWVGFYRWNGTELVLGPFQGLYACVRIPYEKGVCGTAVKENATILVEDVHQFPGHIACDSASNSEIVIPLYTHNKLYGVLDIDSPITCRFSKEDQTFLEACAHVIEQHLL